jgi:hypothetical protein
MKLLKGLLLGSTAGLAVAPLRPPPAPPICRNAKRHQSNSPHLRRLWRLAAYGGKEGVR